MKTRFLRIAIVGTLLLSLPLLGQTAYCQSGGAPPSATSPAGDSDDDNDWAKKRRTELKLIAAKRFKGKHQHEAGENWIQKHLVWEWQQRKNGRAPRKPDAYARKAALNAARTPPSLSDRRTISLEEVHALGSKATLMVIEPIDADATVARFEREMLAIVQSPRTPPMFREICYCMLLNFPQKKIKTFFQSVNGLYQKKVDKTCRRFRRAFHWVFYSEALRPLQIHAFYKLTGQLKSLQRNRVAGLTQGLRDKQKELGIPDSDPLDDYVEIQETLTEIDVMIQRLRCSSTSGGWEAELLAVLRQTRAEAAELLADLIQMEIGRLPAAALLAKRSGVSGVGLGAVQPHPAMQPATTLRSYKLEIQRLRARISAPRLGK